MGTSNSTAWAAASGSAPLLPNECKLLILRQCQGSTLKNARLASKTLARIAEPLLWRNLRIVPNVDCLTAISALLRQSAIACHIHNAIYDASWEFLIDDFRIKCDKPGVKDKISNVPGSEGVSCCKILRKSIQAQIKSGDDGAAEVVYLTRLLLALPNLRELTIREASATFEMVHSVPQYYQKVCKDAELPTSAMRLAGGFGMLDAQHSHTRNFLLAAYSTGRKIETMDLGAVSWHTFFRTPVDPAQPPTHDFRIRQELFRNIKQLDLSFRGSPSRDLAANLKPLRELLKSCETLENLYLSFTNLINRRYSTDHRSFSYLSPLLGDPRTMRPLMPRLRELYLNSAFCTQQDLVHFLAMHTSNLRHVSLSNISLLRHESKDTRSCWVQVIKGMKSLLRLDTVYFSGWLSNGGRQIWHVSEDASEDDRLRPAVIKYLLDRKVQKCPLDHVAIVADQEDLEKPKHGWVEGDWTWTMTYASHKSRTEMTHSGAEMFTKSVPLDSDEYAIANPHFWKSPYKKTYPTYNDAYPQKTVVNTSDSSIWDWADYNAASSWPAPSKKGKQKAVSAFVATSAWDYTGPPIDSFFFGSPSWDAPPPHSGSLSTSSKASPHSVSSHSSASNLASSTASSMGVVDPYFPDDDIVLDVPDFGFPPESSKLSSAPPAIPKSSSSASAPPAWALTGFPQAAFAAPMSPVGLPVNGSAFSIEMLHQAGSKPYNAHTSDLPGFISSGTGTSASNHSQQQLQIQPSPLSQPPMFGYHVNHPASTSPATSDPW